MEQIANVLEVNRTTGSPSGYQIIQAANFAGGTFPGGSASLALDPSGITYCVVGAATLATLPADPPLANLAAWTASACPANYFLINAGASAPVVNSAVYKLCTMVETATNGNNPTATTPTFCRTSQQ